MPSRNTAKWISEPGEPQELIVDILPATYIKAHDDGIGGWLQDYEPEQAVIRSALESVPMVR